MIAGRTHPDVEKLIGCFVNTLVLRLDASGNPRFQDLLARVRQVALDAFATADVPFERLVEDLNPERSMGRHPLVQVMLTVDAQPAALPAAEDLQVSVEPVPLPVAKFDLTIRLTERRTPDGEPAGLLGEMEYRTDLFEPATVDRLCGRLTRMLDAVAVEPGRRIAGVKLLGDAEYRELLVDFLAPQVEQPEGTLPAMFEAQVDRTPDAVAILQWPWRAPHLCNRERPRQPDRAFAVGGGARPRGRRRTGAPAFSGIGVRGARHTEGRRRLSATGS